MLTRLLLDGRKIGDGGIGVYLENLIDGLLALEATGQIALQISLLIGFDPERIASSRSVSAIRLRQCQKRWGERVRFIYEPAKKYSIGEYITLARRQRRELEAHDIFHAPHYTLPFFLEIPAVVTIHDVIHVTHPEHFYHRPVARRLIRSALSRAAHVLTVSEESKKQIQALATDINVPISVVHNALRQGIYRRDMEDVREYLRTEYINSNYCLFVGSDRSHKGFKELIGAWAELKYNFTLGKARIAGDCPDLVLVGRRYSAQSRQEVEALDIQNNTRFIGDVSVNKLSLLYSGARAVIVPSQVEGFGLPALEAMACGATVICSPLPSLREVCQDVAFYTTGFGREALANCVRKVLVNEQAATMRGNAGIARTKSFSLEQKAARVWNIYQQVLGRTGIQFPGEDSEHSPVSSSAMQMAAR